MNTQNKPLVQPGKITLTAVYDGDDYSYDTDSKGRCRLATLLNVSHGNDVLVTTLVTNFPKFLQPLNPQRGAVLEFAATIKVFPLKVGFCYVPSRLCRFRIVALPTTEIMAETMARRSFH